MYTLITIQWQRASVKISVYAYWYSNYPALAIEGVSTAIDPISTCGDPVYTQIAVVDQNFNTWNMPWGIIIVSKHSKIHNYHTKLDSLTSMLIVASEGENSLTKTSTNLADDIENRILKTIKK